VIYGLLCHFARGVLHHHDLRCHHVTHGITIETAADAARALAPLAGQYASWLFAFGLFNASVFAASILPLATAYTVCEGIGWDSGVDKKFKDAPHFYVLYTSLIVLGALAILIPGAPLIDIMLISQVLNGMLLPFVLVFMLLLVNDKKLMGEYTNSKLFNVLAWGTTAIMSILTILLVVTRHHPRAYKINCKTLPPTNPV